MHTFNAAQPALLYLSPACILSALITAAVRGEIKELFAYSTEEDNEEAKKGEKDSKSNKKEKATAEEKVEPVDDKAVEATPAIDEVDKSADADVEDDDYVAVNADDSKNSSPKFTKKKKGGKKKSGK
jgi:minor histocompatibility antigen H13